MFVVFAVIFILVLIHTILYVCTLFTSLNCLLHNITAYGMLVNAIHSTRFDMFLKKVETAVISHSCHACVCLIMFKRLVWRCVLLYTGYYDNDDEDDNGDDDNVLKKTYTPAVEANKKKNKKII